MLSPNPEARMSLSPPFTVEVDGCAPIKGETIPRRNITSKSSLCWQPTANIETVFDIVKYAAAKYGNKKALGSRKLVKKHLEIKKLKKIINGVAQEVDKKWTFFEMSSYEYVSYTEHETLVEKVGSAFRALGMDSSDKVHLFASTRYVLSVIEVWLKTPLLILDSAHWLAIAHGAMSQSMPIVTAYDTLGTEGLRHSLQATRAKAIFLEPHLLKIFFSTFTAETTNYIQIVVYNTECDGELEQVDLTQLIKSYPGLNIMSFDELSKLGEANRVPPVAPKSTDLACVMYTSGSTGT
jgi:long-chain acyl-CoA synthetase